MMATATRKSQGERREEILDAALAEFAEHGYHGGSTEGIARRAGISQPYVFRLFGTKKELFVAVVNRCFRQTLDIFQRAAEGKRGEEDEAEGIKGRPNTRSGCNQPECNQAA